MADGRKTNGGKRAGAGRKSKAEEFGLQELLDQAFSRSERVEVISRLVEIATLDDPFEAKGTVSAAALLLAYAYGRPTERVELTGEDGGAIEIEVVSEQLDRKLASLIARTATQPVSKKPKPR